MKRVEGRRPAGRLRRAVRALRRRRLERRMTGPKLLRAFADAHTHARFVQIGANDGISADPLRPYVASLPWSGVLVEPLPHLFARLRGLYAGEERIALANVAVAAEEGHRAMYHFAEAEPALRDRLPDWHTTVGSFDRELLERQARGHPELEARIIATEVECLRFGSLCRRYGVERLDLLCVDADGYDHVVVGQLDLDELRPRLIVYESVHLARPDAERCRSRLEDAGYETMEEGLDTWCLDLAPRDRLSERWRRLLSAGPLFSGEDLRRWLR